MSTQKQKFELFARLQKLGFTYDESAALRRIEMTLQRWAEQECGDSNEYGSWAIERDETTEKPFRVHHHYRLGQGKDTVSRYAIADREAGALRRLKLIVEARNSRKFPSGLPDADCHADFIHPYYQTDPRGCALYLVRTGDLIPGRALDSCYSRGLAVCC